MGELRIIQAKELAFGWSGSLLVVALSENGCSDPVWQKGWSEIAAHQPATSGWKALLILTSKKSASAKQRAFVEQNYAAKMHFPDGHRAALVGEVVRKMDAPGAYKTWWCNNKVVIHSYPTQATEAALKWLAAGATFDAEETKSMVAKMREQVKV